MSPGPLARMKTTRRKDEASMIENMSKIIHGAVSASCHESNDRSKKVMTCKANTPYDGEMHKNSVRTDADSPANYEAYMRPLCMV